MSSGQIISAFYANPILERKTPIGYGTLRG
jgi:hypothetical protein